MTSRSIRASLAAAFLAAIATVPVDAQTAPGGAPGGGTMTSGAPAPVPTVQPSAGGQVRQPPQNSAMRGSGGFGSTSAAAANPSGLAGMGIGMSGGSTSGLTLSTSPQQGGASGGMGAQSGRNGQSSGQDTTTVSDTGVTQRTPAGANGQQ